MANFHKMLADGQMYEALTVQNLRRLDHEAEVNSDTFIRGTHPHDIMVDGHEVEVKHDRMSHNTGRMCFEKISLDEIDSRWMFCYGVHGMLVFDVPKLRAELPRMVQQGLAFMVADGGAEKGQKRYKNPLYIVKQGNALTMDSMVKSNFMDKQWAWEYSMMMMRGE